MYSEALRKASSEAFENYFSRLKKTGYMRYDRTCELLALSLADSFVNTSLSVYMNEEDYRTVGMFLEILTGRNCLAPWSASADKASSLGGPADFIPNYFRETTSGDARADESGKHLRKF